MTMTDYPHLNKAFREIVDLPESKRILEFKKLRNKRWLGYPKANLILNKLEDLLLDPQTHRMKNMAIYGSTNNGKSRLIRKFLKLHEPYEDKEAMATYEPVVYFEMPTGATPNSLYSVLLDELWVPYTASGTKDEKFLQVKRVLDLLKTKMIIIDEFNNLADTSRLYQLQVLNTIKTLGNKLQIPIVAVGTIAAKRVITSDDQISNRFIPVSPAAISAFVSLSAKTTA